MSGSIIGNIFKTKHPDCFYGDLSSIKNFVYSVPEGEWLILLSRKRHKIRKSYREFCFYSIERNQVFYKIMTPNDFVCLFEKVER